MWTQKGEMPFRGMITNCRRLRAVLGMSWTGKLPGGREVMVQGDLPERGALVAIQTSDPYSTGVYVVRRRPKNRKHYVPPNPQRDAEIYAKRKAGKTLQAIGDEYGLSKESIRRIEVQQWRREQNPYPDDALSTRAGGIIKTILGFTFCDEEPKALAKRVAEAGREAFVGKPNCGKRTIAEMEAWMSKHGYSWKT